MSPARPGTRPTAPRAAGRGCRARGQGRLAHGTGAAVLLLLAGLVLAGCGSPSGAVAAPSPAPEPSSVTRAPQTTSPGWGPVSGQSPVAPPTDRASSDVRPVSLSISAIGVRAESLIPLRIVPATGELEAPADFGDVGWYAAGPTPGDPGPAVIAAHVDSRAGPAPFFRLKELRAGDTVVVGRSDGTTATFSVTVVERYPKAHFPTARVHGPTPDRALRLITCGGSFDYAKRSYRDNIVVYAVRI